MTAVTKFGARLDGRFPDVIHSYLYFFGVWEPGISRAFELHLRPGDVSIDIGANVGVHALLASHLVGSAGRVHAIEASPTIFEKLTHNLTQNRCSNVTAHNVAVTDRAGPVTVFLHDDWNLGGTTIVATEAERRGAFQEAQVDGRPLAEIIPREVIAGARLIKIDVEGAEWLVLQGMKEMLPLLGADCVILVEISADALARFSKTIPDVIALFHEAGFESFEIENSYRPEFYVKPLREIFSPSRKDGAVSTDFGFARPRTRAVLLQAGAV